MTTITFTKNAGYILKGLTLSAFFAATLMALPATADPLPNLSIIASANFNQLAIGRPRAGTVELDFLKPNFIASIKIKSNKTEFNQLAIHHPKPSATERDFFMPKFTAAKEKQSNKLDFTSLDRFFVSLTEQERTEPLSARYNLTETMNYAGHFQPELSRSNLLNSPFANLIVKKLTKPFSSH